MAAHPADLPAVFRFGDRTPCCSAIPRTFEHGRVVCRPCGTIYRNVSFLVRAAFPGALDVTSLTPRRLLKGSDHAVVP